MKKIFSSVVSAAASAALLCGSGYSAMLADAVSVKTGNIEDEVTIYYSESELPGVTLPDAPSILSNYNESSYNYKNYLDENNTAVYDALSVWTVPSEDEITVELPKPISLTLSGLPGSASYTEEDEELFRDAVFSNSKPGIDSLFFDMPEIFWIDTSQLGIGVGEASYAYSPMRKKYTISITSLKFSPSLNSGFDDLNDACNYMEKLSETVNSYEIEGETRYEQIKSIHDSISLFTYYDVDAPFASTAIGSLVEPGVVCEGYSKGLKLICDRLDIPCVLVFGNYDREKNTAHMWNYIMMEDGNWYAVDLTWDDTDGENGQELKYQYFLKGSETFSANHTPDPDFNYTYFTYPELSAGDYALQSMTTTTTASTTTSTTTTTAPTTTSTTTTTAPTTTSTTTTTAPTTTSTTTTTAPTTTSTTTTTAPTTTSTTTTTTTTTSAPVRLRGDFNFDGYVNSADLVLCMRAVFGLETKYNCDYNEDMCVDIYDVIFTRRAVVEAKQSK